MISVGPLLHQWACWAWMFRISLTYKLAHLCSKTPGAGLTADSSDLIGLRHKTPEQRRQLSNITTYHTSQPSWSSCSFLSCLRRNWAFFGWIWWVWFKTHTHIHTRIHLKNKREVIISWIVQYLSKKPKSSNQRKFWSCTRQNISAPGWGQVARTMESHSAPTFPWENREESQ